MVHLSPDESFVRSKSPKEADDSRPGRSHSGKTLWVVAREAHFAPYLTLVSEMLSQYLATKWPLEMVPIKSGVSHFPSFASEKYRPVLLGGHSSTGRQANPSAHNTVTDPDTHHHKTNPPNSKSDKCPCQKCSENRNKQRPKRRRPKRINLPGKVAFDIRSLSLAT